MAGSTPLHKTVHWRRMRDLLKMLCEYENINYGDYDANSINCRTTYGDLINGSNVSCDLYDKRRSYFVSDNEYDIFEIPMISNKDLYGSFLVLMYNKTFDYWLFGKMICSIDINRTRQTKTVIDRYYYDIYGHYSVCMTDRVSFYKTKRGNNIAYGVKTNDICNGFGRKKSYHTSDSKILNKLGIVNDTKNLVNGSVVKIYNKNKSNKNKKQTRYKNKDRA